MEDSWKIIWHLQSHPILECPIHKLCTSKNKCLLISALTRLAFCCLLSQSVSLSLSFLSSYPCLLSLPLLFQNSPSKNRPANPNPSPHPLPPLPSPPPPPARLPQEAAHTSLPQRPQLKLTRVQNQNGIVLSWCVEEADRTCAAVDSYHLYAYHRDHAGAPKSQWKKIGEVKALPLPMACTLTQFVSGSTYYFAVCARDIYSRFGPFCEPQCTDVISSSSS